MISPVIKNIRPKSAVIRENEFINVKLISLVLRSKFFCVYHSRSSLYKRIGSLNNFRITMGLKKSLVNYIKPEAITT